MQDPIHRVTLESHFLHQKENIWPCIGDVFACNYNAMDYIGVICIFIGLAVLPVL